MLRGSGRIEVWGRRGRLGEEDEDIYVYVCLTQKPHAEELS